jgi:hypothetical protein
LPLLASSGEAPQRWAKAASLRSRSGLSPAATRSAEAASVPTPSVANEFGSGLFDQGFEDGVELDDLLFEGEGPAGQHPQAELGQRDDVALGAGSIGRGALEEMEDAEAPELGPDGLWGGRDQVAHLVERLGPSLASRGPGDW